MKKGASKYLKQNLAADQDMKCEVIKDAEETFVCAFCTKELTKQNFLDEPFGNFGCVQKSKLFYHSSLQTVKNQRQFLKNANLSN